MSKEILDGLTILSIEKDSSTNSELEDRDRIFILSAYKTNSKNRVVKNEEGEAIEDATTTPIFSISKHFIRNPPKIKDKIVNLLTNHKCPKLQDFRW